MAVLATLHTGLSAGVGRAIFRAMLPQLYSLGVSANFIIREARKIGVSYRRQTMLSDIRELTGLMAKEAATRSVGSNVLFPKGNMVETDLRRARNYRVFGDVIYTNIETGESRSQVISFYTNDRLSKDDWASSFEEDKEESEYLPEESVSGLTIRSVEHNKGLPY